MRVLRLRTPPPSPAPSEAGASSRRVSYAAGTAPAPHTTSRKHFHSYAAPEDAAGARSAQEHRFHGRPHAQRGHVTPLAVRGCATALFCLR